MYLRGMFWCLSSFSRLWLIWCRCYFMDCFGCRLIVSGRRLMK